MKREQKQSILITGAAAGIGRCLAQELIDSYKLILIDKNRGGGEKLVKKLCELGEAEFYNCDLSKPNTFISTLKKIRMHKDLYAVINNAGAFYNKNLNTITLDIWNSILATNLTSCFLSAKYLSPILKKNSGHIINIASTRALMSEPNTEAYSASKGGIVSLTHSLAISLGPNITVNCISPGWIETRNWQPLNKKSIPFTHSTQDKTQHPAGRVGRPEDIADFIKFILSKKMGFITGTNFVIDGGMTKKMIYT